MWACSTGDRNLGISIPRGRQIWVNDMGAADGLPYAFSLPHSGGRVDLFGNVVFTRCDEYGDTIGLTDGDIKALEAKLHAA